MATEGLTTRIRAAIDGFMGRSGGVPAETGKGAAIGSLAQQITQLYRVGYERSQVHRDMERMDSDCEVTHFSHSTIASRTIGMEDPSLDTMQVNVQPESRENGSKVSDADLQKAQHLIRRLIKRLGLRKASWQINRFMTKFGNEFREIVIDWENKGVAKLQQLPEQTVWPNTDAKGNRVPGYTQVLEGQTPESGIKFAEYEMVHFAFGELNNYLGTPLMKCARRNWNRLSLSEDSTAAARLIRAFLRLVHWVPVNANDPVESKQKSINAYIEKSKTLEWFDQDRSAVVRENAPTTVKTDFYLPDDGSGRGKVEMLDPENAQLQNITDLNYFLDRLITATTIPKRYFPFSGDTPKLSEGGGSAEDKHFACTLMMCQMILKEGFAKIFDIELILNGLNPDDFRYDIRMGDINTTDQLRAAQTQLALSGAMDRLLNQYPEVREHLNVVLREFTRMSDSSMVELDGVKVKPLPEPVPTSGPDGRTQLPGAGNKEARSKL